MVLFSSSVEGKTDWNVREQNNQRGIMKLLFARNKRKLCRTQHVEDTCKATALLAAVQRFLMLCAKSKPSLPARHVDWQQTTVLCTGALQFSSATKAHLMGQGRSLRGTTLMPSVLVKLEANLRFHKFRRQAVFIGKIHVYPTLSWTKWQAEPQTEFEVFHGLLSLIVGGLQFKGAYVDVLRLHLWVSSWHLST